MTADVRGWGYVFWDKERLDGWGVLDEDQRLGGLYRGDFLAFEQDFGIFGAENSTHPRYNYTLGYQV